MFSVLGVPVSCIDKTLLLDRVARESRMLVSFVNPAAVKMVRRSGQYRDDLGRCDLVMCDGVGMVVATRWLRGVRVPRLSFDSTSLAIPLLRWAASTGTPVALIGGRETVADRAATRLTSVVDGLDIAHCVPGYGVNVPGLAADLARKRVGLVIIGAGAPYQERIGAALLDEGLIARVFTCGGYFDQLQASVAYYPAWIDALNLRWCYRLVREPRRLWRRYIVDYAFFAWVLLIALVRKYGTRGHA